MSMFNVASSHPLIPNSNQYLLETKYVSINSQDRNITKYPNAATFEIELPQDYLNVQSVKLYSWSLPLIHNVFSVFNHNRSMTFKFTTLYNPNDHVYVDPVQEDLQKGIYAALTANLDKTYRIFIEDGFYHGANMATELTNQFNEVVTNTIMLFFTVTPAYAHLIPLFTAGYINFIVAYNSVEQKLWFGNTADSFMLPNEIDAELQKEISVTQCLNINVEPSFTNWGLPLYLGFNREPIESVSSVKNPRFYYEEGTDGYWLLPTLPGAKVSFLQAPLKINLIGPPYIYMEIDGLNCVDETSPYNLSKFTKHTNETNGTANSFFAKIPITNRLISQYFDEDYNGPYKWYYPPAERIRKLKIKFRHHNGQLIDFGTKEYSFLLEFTLFRPQNLRETTIQHAHTK